MDAVKFLEEAKRMCNSCACCSDNGKKKNAQFTILEMELVLEQLQVLLKQINFQKQ